MQSIKQILLNYRSGLLPIFLILASFHAKSQILIQDSLTLVEIYNETQGVSWTNQTNWLSTSPVPTWFGIAPIGNRVRQIQLPNNNLNGSIPIAINQLTEIELIDLKNNRISSLDTIKASILFDLNTLDVRSNKLDFGDFEKSLPAFNTIPNFLAFPQDSVGKPTISTRSIHDIKTFQVEVDGSNNFYQWYKNGIPIAGATNSTYSIASIGTLDEGQYYCKIWSGFAVFFGDTLTSHVQQLNVDFCTDSEGGLIYCNQISIQWEPGTTLLERQLLRNEFNAIVLDSCMCEYELWSLADTVILEGGEGEVAKAEGKTRVKDADMNNVIQITNTQSIVGVPPIDLDIQGSPGAGNEVLVAILDSGIDYTHSALEDYIRTNPGEIPPGDNDGNCAVDDVIGYNYMYDNTNPYDDNGHGTHVAGIVKNSIPIGQVGLLNLKIADSLGFGSVFHAICAIEYSIQKQADIINLSWGYKGVINTTLKDVIAKSGENCGALVVAAAGNEYADNDLTPHYPSDFGLNNVISVAALDLGETKLAGFSNYGKTKVDIAAPGTDILSTIPHNAMQMRSGTSMATGFISNAAAKMKYQNPSATYKGIKHCILSEAALNPSWADSILTSGKLDLIKAVNCIDTSSYSSTCLTTYDFEGFLEGPFVQLENHMADSLRARGLLPLNQPYNIPPWHYAGPESASSSIFMISGDDAVVDWILIRRIIDEEGTVTIRDTAALLHKNGQIKGTDGQLLAFSSLGQTQFALIHRNHLAVVTQQSMEEGIQPVSVHFNDPELNKLGAIPTKNINGFDVLIAGDANHDAQINAVDQNLQWRLQNGSASNYLNGADFNMDGQVNAFDLNIFFKVNNSLISFCIGCYD